MNVKGEVAPLWRRGLLASGMLRALVTRGSAAIIQVAVDVGIGRSVGPSGLGGVYVLVSVGRVLQAVGGRGFSLIALRELSGTFARGDRVNAQAVYAYCLRSSLRLALPLSVAFAIVWLTSGVIAGVVGPIWVATTVGALASVPALVYTVSAESMKALGAGHIGLWLQFGLSQVLVLIVLVLATLLGIPLGIGGVFLTESLAFGLVALVSILSVHKRLAVPTGERRDLSPRAAAIASEGSRHLWVVDLIAQVNAQAPLLILPAITSAKEVGVFGVANRLMVPASLLLVAIASVYAPRFRMAALSGDARLLGRLLRRTQVYAVVLFAPYAIFLSIEGTTVLGLFGEAFARGEGVLRVLAIGQFLNCATGTVAHFNYMTRHERFERDMGIVSLAVLLVFAFVVSAPDRAVAMAWAVGVALGIRNIGSYWRAVRTIRDQTAAPSSVL